MSKHNHLPELTAVWAAQEKLKEIQVVSRLDKLFKDEKLESNNRSAAAKHLQMVKLILSQNRIKNP
jgi:hypothetical protein